jgi:hypothetical protein
LIWAANIETVAMKGFYLGWALVLGNVICSSIHAADGTPLWTNIFKGVEAMGAGPSALAIDPVGDVRRVWECVSVGDHSLLRRLQGLRDDKILERGNAIVD